MSTEFISIENKIKSFMSNLDIHKQNLANELGIKEITTPRGATSYGVDPEFFIMDPKNKIVPAFTFLGNKNNKTRILSTEGYIFADGFGIEINTKSYGCRQSFCEQIYNTFNEINKLREKFGKDYSLSFNATEEVDKKLLNTYNFEDVMWGCEPTLNIYDIKVKLPNPFTHKYRYSGGHIHISYGNSLTTENIPIMVKALDVFLGTLSVLLEDNVTESLRRRYYGLPGEYRKQSYGFEYRTLSNYYYKHPSLMVFFINIARAISYTLIKKPGQVNFNASQEAMIKFLSSIPNKDLIIAIRKGNKEIAWEIFQKALTFSFLDQLGGTGHIYNSNYHIYGNPCTDQNINITNRKLNKLFNLITMGPSEFFKAWNNPYETRWKSSGAGSGFEDDTHDSAFNYKIDFTSHIKDGLLKTLPSGHQVKQFNFAINKKDEVAVKE